MNTILKQIKNWRCNGSIHPLIRDWDELDFVVDNTIGDAEDRSQAKAEARRWAKIELECTLSKRFNVGPKDTHRYFQVRMSRFWDVPNPQAPWTDKIKTIAQFVAAHGGTNSRARCHDVEDLRRCIELVGSYNDHNWSRSVSAFISGHRLLCYPDKDGKLWNPNDGRDLYEYDIAWEGSHAVYVRASKMVGHTVAFGHDEGVKPFTSTTFWLDMETTRDMCRPDEFNISQTEHSYLCRFWWD